MAQPVEKMGTIIVRFIATILLLWVVWHHAHWSVALSLSFIFVGMEATNFLLKGKVDAD